MLLAAPVALYLLILNVRAKTPVQLRTTARRIVTLCMLWAGLVGAMASLGCARLEAAWPTAQSDPYWMLANPQSSWKVLGLWLMGVGFVGLLAVSAKPPKAPKPEA